MNCCRCFAETSNFFREREKILILYFGTDRSKLKWTLIAWYNSVKMKYPFEKQNLRFFVFFAFEEMIQNQAKLSKFVFWKRQILFSIKSILFIFSRKNWMAFPIWREENFQFILKWTTSLQCFLFKMLANLGKLC